MKTMIRIIQGVLLLFAFACMWFGTAMVVAIAAILVVIWLQVVLLGRQMRDLAFGLATVAEIYGPALREHTERRNVR